MPNDQGYDEWWGINEGSNAAGYTSTPQSKPTELYDIIRWPGKIPGGKVSDESVADLGIYPTLAHLVGEEKDSRRPTHRWDQPKRVSARGERVLWCEKWYGGGAREGGKGGEVAFQHNPSGSNCLRAAQRTR